MLVVYLSAAIAAVACTAGYILLRISSQSRITPYTLSSYRFHRQQRQQQQQQHDGGSGGDDDDDDTKEQDHRTPPLSEDDKDDGSVLHDASLYISLVVPAYNEEVRFTFD